MMKRVAFALALAASAFVSGAAMADQADAQWVARCVSDNQREAPSVEVITKYCTCMNGKMSSDETLSVSAWEKTHTTEQAACDKESGWK
ncbi:MAG: hypothetical protein WAV02_14935 [Stellaceae bacterium]